jgi:hypothetical protein
MSAGLYEIWKMERRAWEVGPQNVPHVDADAIVISPDPMPIQTFATIQANSERAEPFTDIEFEDRHFVQRGNTVVIAYTASAKHRRYRRRYRARCTSTFVQDGGEWRCIAHSHARV